MVSYALPDNFSEPSLGNVNSRFPCHKRKKMLLKQRTIHPHHHIPDTKTKKLTSFCKVELSSGPTKHVIDAL